MIFFAGRKASLFEVISGIILLLSAQELLFKLLGLLAIFACSLSMRMLISKLPFNEVHWKDTEFSKEVT